MPDSRSPPVEPYLKCSSGSAYLTGSSRVKRLTRYKQPSAITPMTTSPRVAERDFHRWGFAGWSGTSAMTAERDYPDAGNARSEERRVGKECRSRWSTHH